MHSEIVYMLHFVPVEWHLLLYFRLFRFFFYRNFFCHSILMILQRGKGEYHLKNLPGWPQHILNYSRIDGHASLSLPA